MGNSLIKKAIILLASVLITSLSFFAVISITYNNFYIQSVLSTNENISSRWTADIDARLNNIYEHVYDLTATLYDKTQVRSGSPKMSYTEITSLQNTINSKVLSVADITSLFVIDTESDLYLYTGSGVLTQPVNYSLKLFIHDYCTENPSSLNNRTWSLVSVLGNGYYIKSLRMGKYVVGAVSDCTNYRIAENRAETIPAAVFICSDSQVFTCQGDSLLIDLLSRNDYKSRYTGGYAVSCEQQEYADAVTVYITRPAIARMPWKLTAVFMVLDSALCVILVMILINYTNRNVRIPIGKLIEANKQVSAGNFNYQLDISEAGSAEFEDLFRSYNDMSSRIEHLTIESYDLKIKREQNRLKMLRAQMRPHTFLNGITTISNMTYTAKTEDIRRYILAFASFTRYMLHTSGDWTTVGDELKHIDNYVSMQKIRFPNSIEMECVCPEEIRKVKIPYLILFSLVENSFKHAMTLVDTMYVRITAETYEENGFRGIRLTEEDNGPGFGTEVLEKLAAAGKDDPYTKEHLGLTNVRYSLNLIYGRDDLLRLDNRSEGGAHIELLIPEQEEEDETACM